MKLKELIDQYPELLRYDYKWQESMDYRNLNELLEAMGYRLTDKGIAGDYNDIKAYYECKIETIEPMKWISTTIKRKWMDKILSGEKTSELKIRSEHWNKRLTCSTYDTGKLGINFLCGRVAYKYHVKMIQLHVLPDTTKSIDGVVVKEWYEIHLGERIE